MNTREKLIHSLEVKGFPSSFCKDIADQLGTEKAMNRMLGYLSHISHASMEDIADEMIAICDERETWISKKKAEYYNAKYNAYLFSQKK